MDYSLSSSSQRMEQGHSLGMGSGAEMRSHFHFDPQEVDACSRIDNHESNSLLWRSKALVAGR